MPDLLRNRWSRLAAGVAAAGLAVLGGLWTLANDRAGVLGTVQRQERRLSDHEKRLRAIEHDLPAIRTDVSWIRQRLEGEP